MMCRRSWLGCYCLQQQASCNPQASRYAPAARAQRHPQQQTAVGEWWQHCQASIMSAFRPLTPPVCQTPCIHPQDASVMNMLSTRSGDTGSSGCRDSCGSATATGIHADISNQVKGRDEPLLPVRPQCDSSPATGDSCASGLQVVKAQYPKHP